MPHHGRHALGSAPPLPLTSLQLAGELIAGDSEPGRLVAILTARLDESIDDEWFVTAGIIAGKREWGALLRGWRKALAARPDPIEYFSQKEVGRSEHGDCPFYGWEPNRIHAKARQLHESLRIPARHRIVVFWRREDFKGVIERSHLDARLRDEYLIGFVGGLDAVCGYMEHQVGRRQPPVIIFHGWSNPAQERIALGIFDALKEARPRPSLRWLGDRPQFKSDQGIAGDVGLQIADVVAWHWRDALKRMEIKELRAHILGDGLESIHYRAKDMYHLKNFLHEYARRTGIGQNHLFRTPWKWERGGRGD